MANYHEYAVSEVVDPGLIGVGVGNTVSGEKRVCISLAVSPTPFANADGFDWISMTPTATRRLVELLEVYRHLWENA